MDCWRGCEKQRPEESDDQRIERLMRGLASADGDTQFGAKTVFKDIVYDGNTDYSPAYTCAVLQALGQRSDLKDYAWILRLVQYLGNPLAGVRIDPDVRAAAVCIQRLRERYEPEYAANSLLHIPASGQTPATCCIRRKISRSSGRKRCCAPVRNSGISETDAPADKAALYIGFVFPNDYNE